MLARFVVFGILVTAALVPVAHAQQQPLQGTWGSTGQFRGSTTSGGQIYGPDGRYLGQMQRSQTAPTTSEGGFGRATPNGAKDARRQSDTARPVYGANGQYLGQVNRSGQFYDAQGTYRGQMR